MPHNPTLSYYLIGGWILYFIIGLAAFSFWLRRRPVRRPVSALADPEGAIAYMLPILIVVEAFALGGALLGTALMLVALSPGLTQPVLIGGVGGLIFFLLFFVVVDIVWVRRMRALARRNPTTYTL